MRGDAVIMLRLKDTLWVAASDIAEVSIDTNRVVRVAMKHGGVHTVENDYGTNAQTTAANLVEKINHAMNADKVTHEPKFKST